MNMNPTAKCLAVTAASMVVISANAIITPSVSASTRAPALYMSGGDSARRMLARIPTRKPKVEGIQDTVAMERTYPIPANSVNLVARSVLSQVNGNILVQPEKELLLVRKTLFVLFSVLF
mmetsp:Transcript_5886/g.36487  ORF Transcript_5886/g.36487 Transcript_5886/m.36487 type:complete len:120 (+) Transcript_5886:3150-3509(+)